MLQGSLLVHTWGDQSAWCASSIQRSANRNAESGNTLKNPDIQGQQRNPSIQPYHHHYPGTRSKILHPSPLNHLTVLSELQEYRPFSRGRLEWKPLRRGPSSSIWTMSNRPRLHLGITVRFKMPTLHFLVRRLCLPWVVEVIWACFHLLQELAVYVWLVAIQFWEPVIKRACRCQSQTRTRGQGTWRASSTHQLRKLPVGVPTDCTTTLPLTAWYTWATFSIVHRNLVQHH